MSVTPIAQRLPQLSGDWQTDAPIVQEFFARFLSDTVNTLRGNVAGANNLGWQFKQLKVVAPGVFPMTVAVTTKSVSYVDVAQALDVTTTPTAVSLSKPAWSFDGRSNVVLAALPGMTSGHTYQVTLLVVP